MNADQFYPDDLILVENGIESLLDMEALDASYEEFTFLESEDDQILDLDENITELKDTSLERIYTLGDHILDYVESLAEEEDNEYAGEFWAALIPAIVSAVPAIVQGISGLVNKNKQQAPAPVPAPAPAPAQTSQPAPPRPIPAPQRPKVVQRLVRPLHNPSLQRVTPQVPTSGPAPQVPPVTSPAPSPVQAPPAHGAGVDQSVVSQFIRLLSDPSILQLLQAAGASGRQETIELGKEKVPVSSGAILNAIADYAKRISFGLINDNHETPGYLIDENGNFKCDPASPRERAEVLMELYNS